MIELYKELIEFFKERKKVVANSIVLFLLLFGSIIVVSQGCVLPLLFMQFLRNFFMNEKVIISNFRYFPY